MPAALRPYAKAIYPFLLTIVAVLGQWAISGELNRPELVTAITGALSALVTFAVRNEPATSNDADVDDDQLPADPAPPEAADFDTTDPAVVPRDVGNARASRKEQG